MGEQFGVTPEALAAHGRRLEAVRSALGQALDAARTVSLPGDAYGVICQFFPPLIDPVEASGMDTLSAGVDAVARAIDGVVTTAAEYQRVEDGNRESFGGGGR
jgi:hypothetical protein